MKRIIFSMMVFISMAGMAEAASFTLSTTVEFLAPFEVSNNSPISFGQLYLDGAQRTISMDIDALTATAATLADAQTEASTQAPTALIYSDGANITPTAGVSAGYVIIKSYLATLSLQLECLELPSGFVTDSSPLTGDFDISGGSGQVVIKSVYTNLDEINAANAYTLGATDHMPLYFAPSMDVDSPNYSQQYSGDLNFNLVLQ